MIEGDILMPNLGISVQDREMLIEKVNIVFHMAASVRFDLPLKFVHEYFLEFFIFQLEQDIISGFKKVIHVIEKRLHLNVTNFDRYP
jgi:predicted solute-binding protein